MDTEGRLVVARVGRGGWEKRVNLVKKQNKTKKVHSEDLGSCSTLDGWSREGTQLDISFNRNLRATG